MTLWVKALIVVAIIAVSASITWGIVSSRDTSACDAKIQLQTNSTAAATAAAEKKGKDAQLAEDAKELAEANLRANKAEAAIATANQQTAAATAKANQLSTDVARLRKNDPTIEKWYNACLPSGYLVSLHGGNDQAAAGHCQ